MGHPIKLCELGTVTATELARQFGYNSSLLSRLIDRLVRLELIDRLRTHGDRRLVVLSLTTSWRSPRTLHTPASRAGLERCALRVRRLGAGAPAGIPAAPIPDGRQPAGRGERDGCGSARHVRIAAAGSCTISRARLLGALVVLIRRQRCCFETVPYIRVWMESDVGRG